MHELKVPLYGSFMVKFIWQNNIPVGFYGTFKMPLEGWIFGTQRANNEIPLELQNLKSQRSEPKLLLKYLLIPNFCAKFQPNRLTATFGPWNTFSDSDT